MPAGCDGRRSEDLLTPLVLLALLILLVCFTFADLRVYFRAGCALPVFLVVLVILALLILLPVVVLARAPITLTGLLRHLMEGLFLDIQGNLELSN